MSVYNELPRSATRDLPGNSGDPVTGSEEEGEDDHEPVMKVKQNDNMDPDVYIRTPNQRPMADSDDSSSNGEPITDTLSPSTRWDILSVSTVVILFAVNLLNYMDRFTVAGVLPKIQHYYHDLDNSSAGLLQTAFVCSYMIFAPIFGYLGDRYNRKIIMTGGIFFWSITTLTGSFVPKDYFWWFLFLRGLVGIGEASYSTIAPTLIADMYKGNMRSRMLALFYFAIPVGSGLGYIIGSSIASATGSWQWSLRVTPPLGFICCVFVLFVMKEPPRGESEGGDHLHATSWQKDIVSLLKNGSFMWSTVGFTSVAFVAGALAWWGPTFLQASIQVQGHEAKLSDVSLIFGVITVIAGILGVALGSISAQYFKKKYTTADPLVCAFGMMTSMPFLYAGAVVSRYNTTVAYIVIFIGEVLLCLNWSLVADILLYVVIPTRRSTAEAFQILFSHALGDAGSPYIIGAVSDAISRSRSPSTLNKFISLQYALFIPCFISVLGGFSFLICAFYINADKKKADEITRGLENGISNSSTESKYSMTLASVNGNENIIEEPPTKLVNGIPRTSL